MSPTDTEWRILDLLLAADRPQPITAIVEVIGNTAAVAEALDALCDAGLVTRVGQCFTVAPNQSQGEG